MHVKLGCKIPHNDREMEIEKNAPFQSHLLLKVWIIVILEMNWLIWLIESAYIPYTNFTPTHLFTNTSVVDAELIQMIY